MLAKLKSISIILLPTLFLLLIIALLIPQWNNLEVQWPEVIHANPSSPSLLVVFQRRLAIFKLPARGFSIDISPSNILSIETNRNRVYLFNRSILKQETVEIRISHKNEQLSNKLKIVLSTADLNRNGLPDSLELGDNQSFRDWFCSIADSQFYTHSNNWYNVHKDCAGLIEFAYREALKRHNAHWAKSFKWLSDYNINDERPYYYPEIPLLGNRIFKINAGPFRPSEVSNDFALSVQGSLLRTANMHFISKNIRDAKKADILFFFHPENVQMPSHSMIVMGHDPAKPNDLLLLYHTGPDDNGPGFIKKLHASVLIRHPDPSWRPLPQNKYFLGVYRWNILD